MGFGDRLTELTLPALTFINYVEIVIEGIT